MSKVLHLLAREGNQSHHSQSSNFLSTKVPDAFPSEVAGDVYHRKVHLTMPFAVFRQFTPYHPAYSLCEEPGH